MGKSNWIKMLATVLASVGLAAESFTHAEVGQPTRIETQNVSPLDAMGAFSFVYGGKSSSEFLEHWNLEQSSKQLDENRMEHTRIYRDPKTGLEIRSVAVEYKDFPALDWLLYLHNRGRENTPIIEKIEPLDLQLAGDREGFILHYALGDTGGEYVQGFLSATSNFAPKKKVFKPGAIDNAYPRGNGSRRIPLVLAPNGGRSSDGYLPFFNLQWQKGGVVIALGWTGQWEASFGHVGEDVLRIQAGQQLTHFTLYPGETVRTPRILLLFWEGEDSLRGNNRFRQLLMAHYLPRRDGKLVFAPICASVNWTDPDGTYEGPHVRTPPILAERGVEVFWSDMDPDQWYPGGFPNGTGTWEPDPAKYPRGLKPVGDAVRAAGMDYLLWFEPERVHPGSRIDREHPEWVMRPHGEWSQLFRLHDPEARKWLTDYIDVQITAAQLQWLRLDFNIPSLGFWRRNDTPDRQGITEIQHVEGLYAMWDEWRARHPGLIIDSVSSGGRRIDLETCMRSLPLTVSDLWGDSVANQLMNSGLFRWIPMHGLGNMGYEPSYEFRSSMTTGNIMTPMNEKGYLATADPDSAEALKRTVAIYKKVRPYMLGDFYPLFPYSGYFGSSVLQPTIKSKNAWFGHQFHRPDLEAGLAIVFRRENNPEPAKEIKLRDIDPAAKYEISFEDNDTKMVEAGKNLSALRIEISSAPGSAIVYYRRVE